MRSSDIIACSLSFGVGALLSSLSFFSIWRERLYNGSSNNNTSNNRSLPNWGFGARRATAAASLFLFGRGVVVFGITGAPKVLYLLSCNVDINIVMCGMAYICFIYAETVWRSMEKGHFPSWCRIVVGAILVEHILAPVLSVSLAALFDRSLYTSIIYYNWMFFCSFLFLVMWSSYLFLRRFISQLRISAGNAGESAPAQMLATATAAAAKLRIFRNFLLATSVMMVAGFSIAIFTVLRVLETAGNSETSRFRETPQPSTLDASLASQTGGIAMFLWFCWVPAPDVTAIMQRTPAGGCGGSSGKIAHGNASSYNRDSRHKDSEAAAQQQQLLPLRPKSRGSSNSSDEQQQQHRAPIVAWHGGDSTKNSAAAGLDAVAVSVVGSDVAAPAGTTVTSTASVISSTGTAARYSLPVDQPLAHDLDGDDAA